MFAVLAAHGQEWRKSCNFPAVGCWKTGCVLSPVRGSMDCDISATTVKWCSDSGVDNMDGAATIRSSRMEVCDYTDESPARLKAVLPATTPVGVVPLLGGRGSNLFWRMCA